MAQDVLIGVDAGTSSIKALLLSRAGEELAVGRALTPWREVATGSESDARQLATAARKAIADALAQLPQARVLALGVASMGESGVLVDAADAPLGPVIAWHDDRDRDLVAQLAADLGEAAFCATTGLPLWPQWSLTKHRWLREHVPATAAAVRRYSVAEWIVRDLGGDPVHEYSLASRTGWLELATGRPYADALAWSGAPAGVVDNLIDAGAPAGQARTDGPLAALDGAILTVAGHDHQVAAVGLGCYRPGDEFDSAGSAEALLRTADPGLPAQTILELTRAGVTVGRHASPGRWCLLGATQGGLALTATLRELGVSRDGIPALDTAALAADTARSDAADQPGLIRLAAANGEVVINPGATPGDVWRAATRAITAAAAALGDRLTAATGPRRDLVVAGGWTHSSALMAAKTELLGPHRLAATAEAGCRGAALFAGLAAGTYPTLDAAPTAR